MTGDRFELIESIGSGGMASVWRARDRRLDREIALKRPLPHLSEDPAALARFQREGRAAAGLSHPSIVTVYDAGEDEEGPWLAMELVHGISMRRIIDRDGPLPTDRVVDYIRQAAAGLDAAHERGVIHRDIKPANILLGDDGRVRITDFGLARPLSDHTPITQEGAVVGSVRYLAPEVLTGDAGRSADIYSLAAVAYEMLTARPPLDAPTMATLLDRIRVEPPAPPSSFRPLSPAIDTTFAVELSKSVADRSPTAGMFAEALAAAAGATLPLSPLVPASASIGAGQPTDETLVLPPASAGSGPSLPRALKATLLVAGVAVAALIGAALFDGSRGGEVEAAVTTTAAAAPAPTTTEAATTTVATTTTSTTVAPTTTTLTPEAAIVSLVAEISDALDAASPRAMKPKEARDVGKDVNEAAAAFFDGDENKALKKLDDAIETLEDKVDDDDIRNALVGLILGLADLMGLEVQA